MWVGGLAQLTRSQKTATILKDQMNFTTEETLTVQKGRIKLSFKKETELTTNRHNDNTQHKTLIPWK